MGSAEISKNKTRISRYYGDLAKSLWLPLNFVESIERSSIDTLTAGESMSSLPAHSGFYHIHIQVCSDHKFS